MDTLHANIQSLIEEHRHHLNDDIPEDMIDLNHGLSLSILMLAQVGAANKDLAVGTATAYLRTAYGVGYNKGYTDGQDKYEEAIESKEDKL